MTKQISPSKITKTISYLYLLFYSPPEHVGRFKAATVEFKQKVDVDIWDGAIQAACEHIVSFQSASRHPDADLVSGLVAAARKADSNPEAARAFQVNMEKITALPGRSKPDNRLHRKKGCRFCQVPCQHGYFTLISDPNFKELQEILDNENAKPIGAGQPIQAIWQYASHHVVDTLGVGGFLIDADHLGNLAYCLVMLATAKSRFAFPEQQIKKFQELNQGLIAQYQT
jgi:hypothetical protein